MIEGDTGICAKMRGGIDPYLCFLADGKCHRVCSPYCLTIILQSHHFSREDRTSSRFYLRSEAS